MRIAVLAAAAALALSGCATDINKLNAAKYHDAGLAAEWSGNYPQAETYFRRALVNARSGGSPDAAISMSMYNLGRMMGYNCKYEEARNILVASLELEEKVSGPASGNFTKRLFELARLSFDRSQYADAASFYARAIPMGRKLGLEQ